MDLKTHRLIPFALVTIFMLPTAMGLEVELQPTDVGALEPGLGGKDVTVKVTATCEEVWERTPPTMKSNLLLEFATATEPGYVLTGPALGILTTTECTTPTQGTVDETVTFTIAATRDVPAFVATPFTITATLEEGEFGEPTSDSAEGQASTDFYGAISSVLDTPITNAGVGEEVTFAFELTNFGNADTVVVFRLDDFPEELRIIPPPQTIVPYVEGGGGQVTVVMTALMPEAPPGWVNEAASFTVFMDTWAAQDPSQKGNDLSAAILLRVRDVKGIPAPTPLLAAPALLAVALLARRRA